MLHEVTMLVKVYVTGSGENVSKAVTQAVLNAGAIENQVGAIEEPKIISHRIRPNPRQV